jgi:hypothetical protein
VKLAAVALEGTAHVDDAVFHAARVQRKDHV